MARILIVEDDAIVAMDAARALEAAGHQMVTVAATFQEAFVAAADIKPDLVILDVKLANAIDGITVGRELVKRHNVRCLFATGFADEVAKHATDFPYVMLPKPYSTEELLPAVAASLADAPASQTTQRRGNKVPAGS